MVNSVRKLLPLFGLLAACAVQTPYQKPEVDLPQKWPESAPRTADEGRWWSVYGDPMLDALIDESFKTNADLVVAAARVDESRGILREASSFLWPTVDAQVGASRSRLSQNAATSFPGFPNKFDDYRATVNVSYDIDLFGRLRSNVEAARAELAASEASRDAVRLALAAQVAKSYYAMQAFDRQVQLTRETVRL